MHTPPPAHMIKLADPRKSHAHFALVSGMRTNILGDHNSTVGGFGCPVSVGSPACQRYQISDR